MINTEKFELPNKAKRTMEVAAASAQMTRGHDYILHIW